MSSAGSPRQARRRSRVVAVSLVATASLVGTYLGALRPQSTYAATGRGAVETRNGIAPPLDLTPTSTLSGCEDVPGEKTYVDDDTKLQAAVASSVDDSIICITGTSGFRLSKTLVLDDTSITLMGDDSSITLLPAAGLGSTSLRHVSADFSDSTDDTLVIHSLTLSGDDTVAGDGGAIYIEGHSRGGGGPLGYDRLMVVNSSFANNVSDDSGGAIAAYALPLEIRGTRFSDNRADSGGAVSVTSPMFYLNLGVKAYDSHFIGNSANFGGGLALANGNLYVHDSSFSDNIAVHYGGAAFSSFRSTGDFYVYDSAFTKNRGSSGGAIYAGGDLTLEGGTFEANTADNWGGAIYAYREVEVSASVFQDNAATYGGGAIYADEAILYPGSSFLRNSSAWGGAIYVDDGLYINFNVFAGNRAITQGPGYPGRGGAIFTNGGAYLAAYNSVFMANTAQSRGGALFLDDDDWEISTSTFLDNRVTSADDTSRGGAVYAREGNLDLSTSYFANNYAVSGGAVAMNNSRDSGFQRIKVHEVAFVGNDARLAGGGVYAKVSDPDRFEVSNSSFTGNGDDSAPLVGGGVVAFSEGGSRYAPTSDAKMYNTTIVGNRARGKGAGLVWGVSEAQTPQDALFQLTYLTVAGNTLLNPAGDVADGSGVYVYEGVDHATIVNSILWNNTVLDDTASDIGGYAGDDSVTVVTSLVSSLAAIEVKQEVDVIVGDPLLGTLGDSGGPRIGGPPLGSASPAFLPTTRPSWNSPAIATVDPDTSLPAPGNVDQLGATRGSPAVLGAVLNSARPPSPTPVIPPSAPSNATGSAGDGVATITWSAPSSSGSFPVSTFQAVVSPGGQSCLVASSPCTITGLTNGTEYTVRVRALSGAGWGPFSGPSAPFTPETPPAPPVEKTMVITGSRGEVRGRPGVVINGSSTGMVGEQVAPWVRFPGQSGYTEGSARPTVDAEGDFTWQRRTGKKVYVYFRSVDSDVKSNRVIIRSR